MPIILFLVIVAIISSMGMQTGQDIVSTLEIFQPDNLAGAALNPARDLGPRILTAMVGYGSQGSYLLVPT